MSSFTPINVSVRARVAQDDLESGPGPPASSMPEFQESPFPKPQELPQELPLLPMPQIRSLHLPASPLPQPSLFQPLPSLASLPPAPPLPQANRAAGAAEVIDLTGLSDEDDGDEWEDVRDAIDLTNLPSDEEADGHGVHQKYTIHTLPPRRYALPNGPAPISSRTRSRHITKAHPKAPQQIHSQGPTRVPPRIPARVPVRRDVCELCARIVRWGPGCLITKHHLYPQEITRKYADRYTEAQKNSIAFICRPCHDAVHRAHGNKMLADFYYEVGILKADPSIQAHVSSMQRATTPELITRYGDGVNQMRRRKRRARAALSSPQKKPTLKQKNATSRYKLREREARALSPPTPPSPGVRRSARLLAKSNNPSQIPVIVIEDDDDGGGDIQDVVIQEDHQRDENEERRDIVSQSEVAALEVIGEYIPL